MRAKTCIDFTGVEVVGQSNSFTADLNKQTMDTTTTKYLSGRQDSHSSVNNIVKT